MPWPWEGRLDRSPPSADIIYCAFRGEDILVPRPSSGPGLTPFASALSESDSELDEADDLPRSTDLSARSALDDSDDEPTVPSLSPTRRSNRPHKPLSARHNGIDFSFLR